MKTKFLILLCIPVMSFAQTAVYHISGKFTKQPVNENVYLIYQVNESLHVDSTKVSMGSFVFNGSIDEPTKAIISVGSKNFRSKKADAINLYLDKGMIKITAIDSLKKAVISGSTLNDDNNRYIKLIQPFQKQREQLIANYYAASEAKRNSQAFNDSLEMVDRQIGNSMDEITAKFISENPNSFMSLDLVKNFGGYNPDVNVMAPLYNKLNPMLKNSVSGKKLAEKIKKLQAVAIGAIAPEFSLPDQNGKMVNLTDFRGKYVLIDFWASWCGPCRAENPNVVNAYNKYKSKNFTILGVSLDNANGKTAWTNAITKDGLTWTQVSDLKGWKSHAASLYDVQSIPQNFLLDPKGKIIAHNLRGEELAKKLSEIFSAE